MASSKSNTSAAGSASVTAFLEQLDHPHKAGIERLREMILRLDERISEEVKWNAPSFKLEEHFATFKLHPPKNIQVVLHTGAKVKSNAKAFTIDDPQRLLKWPAEDRCVLTLSSEAELLTHQESVRRIIEQWIEQL